MDISAKELIRKRMMVEEDMRSFPYDDKDPLSSKVFKTYPLIGDYIASDNTIQKWHANTKSFIEKKLEDRSLRFKAWVYEQVALIAVHYAKTWNSNEEGRFTKYVAMQLGYKDETGKVWDIISEALETAFKNNKRLFIKRNGDREFYETVMVHSFGPNKSWYPLIDLLFSFYTVNLDWEYVANDPLYVKLTSVLQRYFNNSAFDEDQFIIASKTYSLRVGIRRLVQERPDYCAWLFESIVRRIHQLLKNEAKPSNRYLIQIVDRWFADKISNARTVSSRATTSTKEPAEVALDYSNIVIRYCLSKDKPAVRIPAIRLLGDETGEASAVLYDQARAIETYPLDIHGNELGETIQPKTIVLSRGLFSGDEIRCRLVIIRGSSVIHDTDKRLWRPLLFFSEGREVSASRVKRERYEVYALNPMKLGGSNLDITPLASGLIDLALHKNYSVTYAGNTIAIDYSEVQGIRIVAPSVFESALFLLDGEEYAITKPGASLKVYCANENEAWKYSVVINGISHSLVEFFDKLAGNRALIEIESLGVCTVDISVVDISAGVSVFKKEYCVIPNFNYRFSKKCYVTAEEVDSAKAEVECGDEKFAVSDGDGERIQKEYKNGFISIDIPRIRIDFENIDSVFFDKYYRLDDLEESSCVRFINKSGIPYTISIGDFSESNPNAVFLKKCLSEEPERGLIPVQLSVGDRVYTIANLVIGNWFVNPPVFFYDNNTLRWDGGISFVGDASASLVLRLHSRDSVSYKVDLSLGQPIVGVFEKDSFEDGDYAWEIFADGTEISSGSCFVGSRSKARFSNRIICIDYITEDTDGSSEAIHVKPVFIDQIKYLDTRYVPSEDDIYDVYTGCMYRETYGGDKRYFSFQCKTVTTDSNIRKKYYNLNPVKIIYISDKYLRIVNEADDGIYCYNNLYSSNPGYEITDIEPAKGIIGYLDVLFYLFHTEKPACTNKISVPAERTLEPIACSNPEESHLINHNLPEPVSDEKADSENASLQSLIDTDQSTVIDAAVNERILVNAGPGTGKTWTLIEKIIKMVQLGTDPEAIQVLCFSRAAVEVIRKRMAEAIESGIVDVGLNLVDIRTFDSFASQLLYWVKDSDYKEIGKSFKIEALSYEERINKFVDVLRAQPGLLQQCEHLIVDEVQDLVMSRAKMVLAMIKLLPKSCGVTLFGDACQAIYDYQVDRGISSVDFYNAIEATKQFKYYSFSKNYRQISKLQECCESYRTAILSNNMRECNSQLEHIREQLPEYTIFKIRNFSEDTLDPLITKGKNVGILTRSNAQALMISNLFRKKGIPHVLQHRLSEECLNGWIAVLFNSSPGVIYDEVRFVSALNTYCKDYFDGPIPEDIWDMVTGSFGDSRKQLKTVDLLNGIRRTGTNKMLYTENPVSPVTVSTIHRSKGREYDSVILLDNLISVHSQNPEEQRVNYVALSRAKKGIYKVELSQFFFSTLTDRRSYSAEYGFSGKRFLSFIEIGRQGDFEGRSFCENAQTQEYIRSMGRNLIGKEAFLEKREYRENGDVVYNLVLKETGMVIARTSADFARDLDEAIRKIKKLPWHASIYDDLYPTRFNNIYINDVTSEISMVQGNEVGIKEFDGLVTWNSVLIEGYAKADY